MTENYRGDLMKGVREGLSEKVILKLSTERSKGAIHVKEWVCWGSGGDCGQREQLSVRRMK